MTTRTGAQAAFAVAATLVIGVAAVLTDGSAEPRQEIGGGDSATKERSLRDGKRTKVNGTQGAQMKDAPEENLLGLRSRALSQLDPLTLEPRGRPLRLAEFHDTWSFSPDGSQIALGMGSPGQPVCGAGICIVDLSAMRIVEDIDTPIAAEAVGWPSASRVIAILQSGEVVVADLATGGIVHQGDLSVETTGPPSAATPDGLAVLVGTDPVRLAVVDDQGNVRTVDLERVRIADRPGLPPGRAGLITNPAGTRVFVFAAGAPAVEVDLRTMRVHYRLPAIPGPVGTHIEGIRTGIRDAVWLGRGLVAVVGQDLVKRRGGRDLKEIPTGIHVIDTETWSVRTLHERANRALGAAGRLLIYRRSDTRRPSAHGGIGLQIYTRGGRKLLVHRFGDEALNVQVGGAYAFAIGSRSLRTVDVRSGLVVHRSSRSGSAQTRILNDRLSSGTGSG